MLGGKPFSEWIEEYERSHQHPANRACHMVGIPMIASSVPLFLAVPWARRLWKLPVAIFTIGWGFQFLGHAIEGKPPEFFRDWRFLFVGLRWWLSQVGSTQKLLDGQG
jgi:uncharacterized membrane protein YGL010W